MIIRLKSIKKLSYNIFIVVLIFTFSGCGTISGNNKLYFYSNSSDARIDVNGKDCKMPCGINAGMSDIVTIVISYGDGLYIRDLKSADKYPNLGLALSITLFIIPGIIDLAMGAAHVYDITHLYFYFTDDNILLFNLETSAFAYSMYSYNHLKRESMQTPGPIIERLSKITNIIQEEIIQDLSLTASSKEFAEKISKKHVMNLISQNYSDMKQNITQARQFRNKIDKSLQNIAMDSFNSYEDAKTYLIASRNENHFILMLYNNESIISSYNYAADNYSNITVEYDSEFKPHILKLMELSGLTVEQLKYAITSTQSSKEFAKRIRAQAQRAKIIRIQNGLDF